MKDIGNRGSFTIEAVIIFWVIFSLVMVVFFQIAWTFQKAAISHKIHRALVESKSAEELVYTSTFKTANEGVQFKAEIEREVDTVSLVPRLFILSRLLMGYQEVISDE